MKNELNISLFRFNHNFDYLPYYKKYTIFYKSGDSVYDILELINKDDNFSFDIKAECDVNINGLFLSANTLVNDIVLKLGNDLQIEPISKYRAKIDLIIDIEDYIKKLELFDKYLTQEQKRELKFKYTLEYYASNTLNYNRDYIGDHNLLIAHELIKSDENLKDEIVTILKNKTNGIWYHTSLQNRLFNDIHSVEEKIKELFEICQIEYSSNNEINSSKNVKIKQSFEDFNIASYNTSLNLNQNINKSKAKYIELSSKNNDIASHSQDINKSFSLKIAGDILLEAKDKNADFIIVNNNKDLDTFDKLQNKIESKVGRDINLPVITQEQFLMLLEGEKDINTLNFINHKVKVSFLDY